MGYSLLWLLLLLGFFLAAKTIAKVTLGAAGRPEREEIEARYQGRVRVVGPGSSLQISHLSREDAGSYRAHVYLRDSPETHTWEYLLQVYEGGPRVPGLTSTCSPLHTELVSQPHVKMSSRVSENGSCTTILTCVADGGGDSVTYGWTPLGPRTVVSHKGSVLSVSSRPEDGTRIFTCVVKNAVSNSSSLPVWVLPSCTGTWNPSPHLCRPGILGGDAVGEIVTGTLGESATLTLEVPVGEEVESVTWSSCGLLAVLQPREAGVPTLASSLLGRPEPSHAAPSLLGTERLQEPNITARSLVTEDGTCSLMLTCSLQQAGEDVQYLWDPHSPGTVVSHGGTTLTVSWRAGSSDSLRCTTRNPVSHSSSSILARPLCSGNSSL
ncbi:T-lymphocyte surface antigen Ly-9 [Galemys pyrenaicus]|uniref:T-lymphocyte surface antigen Ly-9 n=1 Tax=Galemys pyrenaicus TaxID=202257 RepID=A0A8J5ZXZ9_GALPY|nr:T-lymphocyte surface antigen Ly-9 [Galemys pyrenaicus]